MGSGNLRVYLDWVVGDDANKLRCPAAMDWCLVSNLAVERAKKVRGVGFNCWVPSRRWAERVVRLGGAVASYGCRFDYGQEQPNDEPRGGTVAGLACCTRGRMWNYSGLVE